MSDSGDFGATDSITAYDRAASHPNPAFDFLTGFAPRKLKDLFKWSEYLLYNSAHIFAGIRKFGEMVVTNVEYSTSNEALRRKWRRLYDRQVNILTRLLMASLDKWVYGNHFTSIYFPFVRYLRCQQCDALVNIKHVDYKFKLKPMQFTYRCRKCKKDVVGKVHDRKIIDPALVHIIRWDPKMMEIDHNPMSGQSIYYYNIPQDIKDKVKLGSKHLINTMPFEFLEAMRDDKLFQFDRDAIFHLKVPGPAGIDPQWGMPPLASTLKLFLYTMVLRKANEAIALEHIVPFRVMHPAQTNNMDPAQMISLSNWQRNLKEGIRRFRRDPLHILFAPVAVGVTNIGGEGRTLLVLGEVQEADKAIMIALGMPPELLTGTLNKASMEGTLKLVQNQLQPHADDLNGLLQWYTDKLSKYLGWEALDTTLVPLKLTEDADDKQMLINLATGQAPMVSITTMSERTGLKIDLAAERDKRRQEALDEAQYQQDLQIEIKKRQNTLAIQVQQQIQGNAGLNYDPQAVIGQAEQIVQQLMGLDDGSRRSQLHDLQTTDYVMYSVVVQRLEQQETSQRMQLDAQLKAQQGGQGGAPPAAGG